MTSKTVRKLSLESLAVGIPVMPLEAVGFYKQNCMVCFDSQGHKSGVELEVQHEDSVERFEIDWSGGVTERLKKAYGDLVQATEHAACALALLLIRELTEFTTIEQSSIGTTIDYYLASKKQDEMLIFNHAARLEVSGILRESPSNTVESRVKQKIRRLKQELDLPTFIVVVEFSKPRVRIVKL